MSYFHTKSRKLNQITLKSLYVLFFFQRVGANSMLLPQESFLIIYFCLSMSQVSKKTDFSRKTVDFQSSNTSKQLANTRTEVNISLGCVVSQGFVSAL